MAGAKEIRTKIASIKNTQKITKAMEMVAASKMRRAQERMHAARPYATRMRNVVAHAAAANSEYRHPYLIGRETVKNIGYIIVSSDRGLCGGLNANLFKSVIGEIADWQDKGVEVDMVLVGAKAVQFFRRMGGKVVGTATHLGDRPSINDLIGSMKIMLHSYEEGTIDRLFLVHNEFVSAMSQKLPTDWLRRGGAFSQALRGAVVGAPLPICACGVLPLAESLRRRGAGAALVVAFLLATPELGVETFDELRDVVANVDHDQIGAAAGPQILERAFGCRGMGHLCAAIDGDLRCGRELAVQAANDQQSHCRLLCNLRGGSGLPRVSWLCPP